MMYSLDANTVAVAAVAAVAVQKIAVADADQLTAAGCMERAIELVVHSASKDVEDDKMLG